MEADIKRKIDSSEVQVLMNKAVRQAVLRHKKLGESTVVWQDGRVVILSAEEISVLEDFNEL